jgi:hypothetical protein
MVYACSSIKVYGRVVAWLPKSWSGLFDEGLPTQEVLMASAANEFEASDKLARKWYDTHSYRFMTLRVVESPESAGDPDTWQEWAASLGAAAAAAAPWVLALSPLLLGPALVFGPPAVDGFIKFLKSLGWIS